MISSISSSWQSVSRIRAMLSFAALLALSSTLAPGLAPQRVRALRTGGIVQRLQVSRWCGASPPDAVEDADRHDAGASRTIVASDAHARVAGLPLPTAAVAPVLRVLARIPSPILSAVPWRGLSAFESRPPPVA